MHGEFETQVSGKSLQLKLRYSRQGTLFSKQSTLNYWQITTALKSFIANFSEEPDVNFVENASNGISDTGEKVQCSSSKTRLITGRSQPNTLRFSESVWCSCCAFSERSLQYQPRYRREHLLSCLSSMSSSSGSFSCKSGSNSNYVHSYFHFIVPAHAKSIMWHTIFFPTLFW